MRRNSNSHYFYELRRAKIDYVFRAYVMHQGESWPDRYTLLCRLAAECGDHRQWGETVHPEGERQEWIVWAFKDYRHKLSFEAGVPAIMAREITLSEIEPLPVGRYGAARESR